MASAKCVKARLDPTQRATREGVKADCRPMTGNDSDSHGHTVITMRLANGRLLHSSPIATRF